MIFLKVLLCVGRTPDSRKLGERKIRVSIQLKIIMVGKGHQAYSSYSLNKVHLQVAIDDRGGNLYNFEEIQPQIENLQR